MALYYVGLENGTCSILKAVNKQDAVTHTRREEGTVHATNMTVRLATDKDVGWHEQMGGHVYETARQWEVGKWASKVKT